MKMCERMTIEAFDENGNKYTLYVDIYPDGTMKLWHKQKVYHY